MEPLKKILLCLRNVFTKKDDSVIPTDFSDLAPLDSIDNTSEYLNALDWALKNRRIRNVALCGPYGAGKSSIINSYLKSHADAQQKSLRISMATFIESKTEGSDSSHSVALKPDEIETGILKQLFYKVPHTKIPQSRYRKLHKGGKLIAWRNLVLISIFLLLLGFIFAPDHVINVINILYETWPFSTPPAKVAIVAFAILFTGVLGSIAWCFYPAFSRMKISSISISAKANVEGDEESKESIFNKNMDEIVYFFEETRYRYEFEQKEIYNYNLLEYLLSSDLNTDKRDIFIKQLSDETKQSWEFIDTFFNTTKYKDLFIQLLSTSWPKIWRFIAENSVLTYGRQIEYLSTMLSCLPSDQLLLINSDNEVTQFFNEHKDILQKLRGLDSDTLIQAISIFDVRFEDLATENVSGSVLEYTFEHNHYKINVAMISDVVRFVDADRVAHLKTQNYTTVCSLGYHPLLLYIQENCTFYVENVILREENNLENENAVVDLIDRIFPNIALCQKLIEHENMCISNLESCCSDRLQESPDSVRQIWDFILGNQKLKPIWENILIYKNAFNFTPKLISFMVSASAELGKANTGNVPHSFIQDFIKTNDNEAFPILIPHLRLDPFDVPLSQIAEENVSILIDYRHIPFTPDQMKELKKQYPSLQAKFILQNQAAAFSELNSVPMDQNLFQELLLDPRLESQYRQTLFDSYYQKYLNAPIAGKVDELRISVNHDEFEEVWQLLSDGDRENFLLSHLEILNGDDFEKCFAKMEPPFNLLSNRTQRNQVTVPWKNGIKQLLDRLKAVKYITSYTERAAAQQNDGSRQDEKSNSSVYIVRIKVLK